MTTPDNTPQRARALAAHLERAAQSLATTEGTRPAGALPDPSNLARPGKIKPADRIGELARVLLVSIGDRPGKPPAHVGPPPTAAEPDAPAPLPADEVLP
ncbi:hypothetical protein [Nocardia sp. XZ_19_385]|uniref:hypothetical protein n=1 Tax=Nocardia sp. XZ_19_385 TaxID=2769488 RepID=UPI00188EE5BA|nr:hypothetical protein [Nocardia sp. XZ_19_385]